jgi:hypothetical protein
MSVKQWERLIENVNTLGLAALSGGVADGLLDGSRRMMDGAGVVVGILLMGLAILLTKKLNGGNV